MMVYVVNCRIEGQSEFSCLFARKEDAKTYCDEQNKKSSYYGRYSFHSCVVRGTSSDEVEHKRDEMR